LKRITRGLALLASLALGAASLTACSSLGDPQEAMESRVRQLLSNMQEGKVQEALDMFDTGTSLLSILETQVDHVPTMQGKYKNIKFTEFSEFGKDQEKGLLTTFSFDVGGDTITQTLKAKVEGSTIKFTSSLDQLFGEIKVSSHKLTGGHGKPPVEFMEDMLIEVGSIPYIPSEGSDQDWVIKSVPVGNYKFTVRNSKFVTADRDTDSTLEVRPIEGPLTVNLSVEPSAADQLVQDNWTELQAYILRCAASDNSKCTSTQENMALDPYWTLDDSTYLMSVDADQATGRSNGIFDGGSSIMVPVSLGGVFVRSPSDGAFASAQTVQALASVTLSSDQKVSYTVEFKKVSN